MDEHICATCRSWCPVKGEYGRRGRCNWKTAHAVTGDIHDFASGLRFLLEKKWPEMLADPAHQVYTAPGEVCERWRPL